MDVAFKLSSDSEWCITGAGLVVAQQLALSHCERSPAARYVQISGSGPRMQAVKGTILHAGSRACIVIDRRSQQASRSLALSCPLNALQTCSSSPGSKQAARATAGIERESRDAAKKRSTWALWIAATRRHQDSKRAAQAPAADRARTGAGASETPAPAGRLSINAYSAEQTKHTHLSLPAAGTTALQANHKRRAHSGSQTCPVKTPPFPQTGKSLSTLSLSLPPYTATPSFSSAARGEEVITPAERHRSLRLTVGCPHAGDLGSIPSVGTGSGKPSCPRPQPEESRMTTRAAVERPLPNRNPAEKVPASSRFFRERRIIWLHIYAGLIFFLGFSFSHVISSI
nr:unnamed protein product [Digitaria exilis]